MKYLYANGCSVAAGQELELTVGLGGRFLFTKPYG